MSKSTTCSSLPLAYRVGNEFTAQPGYIAPNICAATGTIIKEDTKPTKVYLTTGDGWEKRLLYKALFYTLITAAFITTLNFIENGIIKILALLTWYLILKLAYNYKTPFIQVHYSKPYQTKKSRRNTLATLSHIAAISIIFLPNFIEPSSLTYLLFLPLLITASILYTRHPVEYESAENGHH